MHSIKFHCLKKVLNKWKRFRTRNITLLEVCKALHSVPMEKQQFGERDPCDGGRMSEFLRSTSIVQVPLFWISQRLSKPGVREEKFSSICVVTSFTKRAVVSHIEFYFTAVTTRFISKYIKIYHCLWMAIVLILLYITQMTNNWFASPVNLENTSVSVTYRVRQEKSTKKWKCFSAARTLGRRRVVT